MDYQERASCSHHRLADLNRLSCGVFSMRLGGLKSTMQLVTNQSAKGMSLVQTASLRLMSLAAKLNVWCRKS
jgi:hypothetical protein